MGSMQVDVRPDPVPPPPALGLESDWHEMSDVLVAVASGQEKLRLWNRDAGDAFGAIGAKRSGVIYVAATNEDAGADSELIEIERDLFDLVNARRTVIAIDLDGDQPARLVSFESVRDLFEPTEPPVEPDELEPSKPEPSPEPEKPAASSMQAVATPAIPPAPANKETPPAPVSRNTENAPSGGTSRLRALTSPRGFPDSLQSALVTALRPLADSFSAALLFQVEYVDGQTEFLVGFSNADDTQEIELEDAVNSALAAANRNDIELGIHRPAAPDPRPPCRSRFPDTPFAT